MGHIKPVGGPVLAHEQRGDFEKGRQLLLHKYTLSLSRMLGNVVGKSLIRKGYKNLCTILSFSLPFLSQYHSNSRGRFKPEGNDA